MVFDVGMTSGGKDVHDLDGKGASLYISLGNDWTADNLKAYYVAEDGQTESVPLTEEIIRDKEERHFARLNLKHFSTYVLVRSNPEDDVCPRDESCPLNDFTDLDLSLWYHDGIHFALETGIMNGMGSGKFEPETATNRAMIVTMLWRLEGKPEADYEMTFTDVSEEEWYTEAIRWAAAEDIVKGYNAETFGTEDPVTREQIVTLLYRFAQYKGMAISIDTNILDYDDVNAISNWAVEAFQWAVQEGIINGMGNGTLSPATDATRAQVATMLMRYDGLAA